MAFIEYDDWSEYSPGGASHSTSVSSNANPALSGLGNPREHANVFGGQASIPPPTGTSSTPTPQKKTFGTPTPQLIKELEAAKMGHIMESAFEEGGDSYWTPSSGYDPKTGRKLKKRSYVNGVKRITYTNSEIAARKAFNRDYGITPKTSDAEYFKKAQEIDAAFGFGGEMDRQIKAREDAMRNAFVKDLGGIEKKYGTNSFAALRQMNSAYGLGVNPEHLGFKAKVSNMAYKASGGRIGSNTYSEGLARVRQAYNMKLEQFINEARPGKTMEANTGAISNDVMRRNWMSSHGEITKKPAPSNVAVAEKSGGGILKGKGKALGALVGVFALGGVIGNMLSGGHRSNAELYNPNGYQQYYS